jgi:hypothetical protein
MFTVVCAQSVPIKMYTIYYTQNNTHIKRIVAVSV